MNHILFISHDANRAGAQLFLLNIMKDFKKAEYSMEMLCLVKWGPLLADFESICKVHELPKGKESSFQKLTNRIRNKSFNEDLTFIENQFGANNFDLIYANTIASAEAAIKAKEVLNIPLITHIHELQFSLELYANAEDRERLLMLSDGIIACSKAVKENLIENNHPELSDKTHVIHSFVDNENVIKKVAQVENQAIKREFNLPDNTCLIGACGNAEWRKGLDVFINFISAAVQHPELKKPIHFVWIGLQKEGEYYDKIMYDVAKMEIGKYITFIEPTPKAVEVINTLDVFVVSSREDPFPLVMLEAALCRKPILGFEKSGGCSEFVSDEAGLLAPYLNINLLVSQLLELLQSSELRKQKGDKGYQLVTEVYNFETSVSKLKSYLSKFS